MLMDNVQLTGSKGYDYQMEMYTTTNNEDVSIKTKKTFQCNTKERCHISGQVKKCAIKQKWIERDYHVQ